MSTQSAPLAGASVDVALGTGVPASGVMCVVSVGVSATVAMLVICSVAVAVSVCVVCCVSVMFCLCVAVGACGATYVSSSSDWSANRGGVEERGMDMDMGCEGEEGADGDELNGAGGEASVRACVGADVLVCPFMCMSVSVSFDACVDVVVVAARVVTCT